MQLINDKENSRFTMEVKGDQAKIDYKVDGKMIYLNYAEVPNKFRGQGIGKVMVEQAFEILTKEGFEVVAVCGFVKMIARDNGKWRDVIKV